jgi:hypothetical protein
VSGTKTAHHPCPHIRNRLRPPELRAGLRTRTARRLGLSLSRRRDLLRRSSRQSYLRVSSRPSRWKLSLDLFQSSPGAFCSWTGLTRFQDCWLIWRLFKGCQGAMSGGESERSAWRDDDEPMNWRKVIGNISAICRQSGRAKSHEHPYLHRRSSFRRQNSRSAAIMPATHIFATCHTRLSHVGLRARPATALGTFASRRRDRLRPFAGPRIVDISH